MKKCDKCGHYFDEYYVKHFFHEIVSPKVQSLCEPCWEDNEEEEE